MRKIHVGSRFCDVGVLPFIISGLRSLSEKERIVPKHGSRQLRITWVN